jgi:hypothetical protein
MDDKHELDVKNIKRCSLLFFFENYTILLDCAISRKTMNDRLGSHLLL